MKSRFAVLVLIAVAVLTLSALTHASVEWDLIKTYKIEGTPLDVAVSANGRWIFVLIDKGEILVYSPDGTINGKIPVGKSIDRIKPGPREDVLLLSSKKDRVVQIITFDLIQKINVSGSPYKGPVDAGVAIAVFSDFE
jgi:hypothetical protein